MTELEIKPFIDAESIKDGQLFVFMDEGAYKDINVGTEEKPETKKVFQVTISTNAIEYLWTMNSTSQLNFIKKLGKDTAKWVGKKGKFSLVMSNVFGKQKLVVYGAPLEKEMK
jgi:hypothetical protein